MEGIKLMNKKITNRINVFLFLLPALVLFLVILIIPIGLSGYYSLQEWNGIGAMKFVGIENYKKVFSDSVGLGPAIRNSIILAILSTFVQLPVSLGLALLLGKGIKGERIFLSVFFMPVLISTVVIGQLWLKIYYPEQGMLSVLLSGFKIGGKSIEDGIVSWINNMNAKLPIPKPPYKNVPWLGNQYTALACCFIPILWQYVGYHMLLLYAGVKSVPPELREAAKIDGATDGQINKYIVIPQIKPIIKICVIFAVTGSLKSFDLIYVLVAKPKVADVPSTVMYNEMFSANNYGTGSAIAVMLIVLCFVFAMIISAIFKKED
ncbi:MAG: sugar ABC transporter permease [Lachnospiraceae bacterium]|nr:sugar ABC transporter permease [Lachnospiraceae bacterium]